MIEWVIVANFAVNLLIIPLIRVLVSIKLQLERVNGRISSLERRVDRIDRRNDAQDATTNNSKSRRQ